jgi:1-acyl-sn-glycerol-3-phosphate acyltransferase
MKLRAIAGSVAFAFLQVLVTPPWALASLLTFPLPPLARYRVISAWSRVMVRGARMLCGIHYVVHGRENIPPEPCIILAKHESAWETLALQVIFPPQVWVVKRELLWIPFFGWGLAMLSPVAIDRKAGRRALAQLLEQGRERLDRGFSNVIFPEGTRIAPGARGEYHTGGAWLALNTGAPIVPVAHNAGSFWPRNAFIKRPGTITVSIGAAIRAHAVKPAALMHNIERWIEDETRRIRAAES